MNKKLLLLTAILVYSSFANANESAFEFANGDGDGDGNRAGWMNVNGQLGIDPSPWVAEANFSGTNALGGIVVTDSTKSGCEVQFAQGMANAISQGYTFGNIRYCHYRHIVGRVYSHGGELEEALSDGMIDLEIKYNIDEYLQEKNSLLETYRDAKEVLSPAPRTSVRR